MTEGVLFKLVYSLLTGFVTIGTICVNNPLSFRGVLWKVSSSRKLWYQRLRLDNKFIVCIVFVAIIAEYLSLPFLIGLPEWYYLSFNALTLYVDIGLGLLMVFYPAHLLGKHRKMLEELEKEEVVSDLDANQPNVQGRMEKYLPLVFGLLIIIAFVYDDLSKGMYGVFNFTDIKGNIICIQKFPFTLIHDMIITVELFFLGILAFSALTVIWKVTRSLIFRNAPIKVRIISPKGDGGLSPIGKLISEVVLLVMILPTIYAAFSASYYLITGSLHLSIVIVTVLSYGFIFVLIPPPLLTIHRVMVGEKEQALSHITRQIENLRGRINWENPDDTTSELMALNSLLTIQSGVTKMRTFPLDASSLQRISLFMLCPILACISVILETYLGTTGGLVLIGVALLSVLSQLISSF